MVTHADSSGPRPGEVLGRYQLLIPVAKGGMGQVWVARLTGTRGFQKLVALKTILPSSEDAANLESMLFDEASLASQIHHPNVAETLDLGEQDGLLYLVMEWVFGEPLDHVVRAARNAGGVPLRVAVDLIAQGCRGLHAAHNATNARGEPLGIVHRDVSPQNLLVTYNGVVKLVDFGVAKATQQMARPTTTGEVKGKFAYMAPEQIHGAALDARADVFAMGIVLYWLTTGKHPFRADNAAATLRNILSAAPALPSATVADYPPALEAVVMKALAVDKNQRHASAQEMAAELERALPPASTEPGESETRAFMRRMFTARHAERTGALEAALQSADSGLALASGRPRANLPASQSTMRAVYVESAPDLPDAPPPRPMDIAPRQRSRRGIALWLAVSAGAAGIILVGAGKLAFPRSSAPGAAAPVPGPRSEVLAPAPPPAPGLSMPAVFDGGSPAASPISSATGAANTGAGKRRSPRRDAPSEASSIHEPPRVAPTPDPLNRRK